MKLTLIASQPLKPYLERLIPASPHTFQTVYLPQTGAVAFLQELLASEHSSEAVILADGAAFLPAEGLKSTHLPLILPRVHHAVSLLCGEPGYRALFDLHGGGLCWRFPLWEMPVFFSPPADCSCLYYLADTHLAMPDDSLTARATAQRNGWDFCNIEADYSLLTRLLAGDWDNADSLIVPTDEVVYPVCSHSLVGLRP